MLEWQIWYVVDPAEEFLGRVRRRWKHADRGGEQDAKEEGRLEVGHLRFGEYQCWRWPWRGQDRTPAPRESIGNVSASGMFGEFDELKSASREAQDSIILFI